jgi:hypothetical protein
MSSPKGCDPMQRSANGVKLVVEAGPQAACVRFAACLVLANSKIPT